jgi:DNA topoisomerase-1
MVIKDGRFGPYVTDGETNASLRKGDEVAAITPARGAELLADRRAAAPAPRARKASPPKTTGTRTTGAKPAGTAKKATATAKKATTSTAAAAKKPGRARKSSET